MKKLINFNLIFSFIFTFYLFILLYSKNLSFNNTYFDLGVYYNQINFFNNGDYWILLYGHFSPYILFLSIIEKILFFLEIDIILILINCLIFFLTALIISKNYSKLKFFIFIFFYPLYHSFLHDFHIEITILPLCLGALILIDKKKFKLSYLLITLIFFTKISLYLSIISLGIILYIKNKKSVGIIFTGLSSLILIIYYFFIRNNIIYFDNKELLFSGLETILEIINKSLFSYGINFFIGIMTVSSCIFVLNYKKIFNLNIWLSITPVFAYYLLAGNTNYLLPIYHYVYQFLPFIIFYSFKEENYVNKINLKQFVISILSFIFLSVSPISIMFYNDIRMKYDYNSFFDYKNGKERTSIILEQINEFGKDSILSVSNNIVFSQYLEFKSVFPFGQDLDGYVKMPDKYNFGNYNKIKIDYFIIDKKSKYIIDKIVSEEEYESILSNYQNAYSTLYEDDNLIILNNEL